MASPTLETAKTINVGTRRSLLARVQADGVVTALKKAWPDKTFKIHAMATAGDNNQTTALYKFNDKALWTQELEQLLLEEKLDMIVHCLKDMPTQLPKSLKIGAVTARGDPHDALVVKASLMEKYKTLSDLPAESVVGTSSLRRSAQMKRFYPQLKFADTRGNVGTRLAKLDDPESPFSAIVLAVAGLERLGMMERVSQRLSKDNGGMLYAVGQGALAIEVREDDQQTAQLLEPIICERTFRAGLAERSLMRTLEGGCSVPIGIETEWIKKSAPLVRTENATASTGITPATDYDEATGVARSALADDAADLTDDLLMRAIVVSLDGQDAVEVECTERVSNHNDAEEFGWHAAKLLVDKGADKILERINLDRNIVTAQGNA